MKVRSAKNKAVRLQNLLRDKLLEAFTGLTNEDVVPCVMGMTGEDIKMSPAARKQIPYSWECKNQEKISIWSALQQAEDNSKNNTPVVVFKRNRSKTYVAIDLETFIKLISK